MQPGDVRTNGSTAWMDLARVVAMVLVVLDHAVINVSPLARADTSDARWWVAEPLLAVSRLAVPVFVMVSGALLLDPTRTEAFATFARRRLTRVGVPLLFWAVAYLTFRQDVLGEDLSGGRALREFAEGEPYYHLYYLYIALGLYALTPALRRLIAHAARRTIVVLCVLAFAVGIVDQFLRTVVHIDTSNGVTLFVDYVGFYLAGWLLRDVGTGTGTREKLRQMAAPSLLLALSLVVLGAAALIEAGYREHWFYPATYLSPAVIWASLALFVLLQRPPPRAGTQQIWRRLSDLSLGTYLVHPMVLDLIRREHSMPSAMSGLIGWVFTLTCVGLLVGAALTAAARLVPGLRRVV